MTAIMDPPAPDTDDHCATACELAATTATNDDRIPLESMTWPELKRVARSLDLKLNVKKPLLIRQIREARADVKQEARFHESIRGRMFDANSTARERWRKACNAAVNWWQGDDSATPQDESNAAKDQPAKWVRIALWCGGIALGCVAGLIFALM